MTPLGIAILVQNIPSGIAIETLWGPRRTPGAGGAQVPTMGFGAALLAAERGENDLGRYMRAPRL